MERIPAFLHVFMMDFSLFVQMEVVEPKEAHAEEVDDRQGGQYHHQHNLHQFLTQHLVYPHEEGVDVHNLQVLTCRAC